MEYPLSCLDTSNCSIFPGHNRDRHEHRTHGTRSLIHSGVDKPIGTILLVLLSLGPFNYWDGDCHPSKLPRLKEIMVNWGFRQQILCINRWSFMKEEEKYQHMRWLILDIKFGQLLQKERRAQGWSELHQNTANYNLRSRCTLPEGIQPSLHRLFTSFWSWEESDSPWQTNFLSQISGRSHPQSQYIYLFNELHTTNLIQNIKIGITILAIAVSPNTKDTKLII